MRTIAIDDAVYSWIEGQIRTFEDTPNAVLRRVAELDLDASLPPSKHIIPYTPATSVRPTIRRFRENITSREAYRGPVLKAVLNLGGGASRVAALNEVKKLMDPELTTLDKEDIDSGGCPRWQKSAEYMLHDLRRDCYFKSVSESGWGNWVLTDKGKDAAQAVRLSHTQENREFQ